MAKISEDFPERSVQSFRINDRLLEICKQTGIPLSTIVENSLVNFSLLNDNQRIQFLYEYNPDKVESDRMIVPQINIAEVATAKATESLGKQAKGTSTKMLLAIGLGILAALFVTKGLKGGE